MLSAEVRFAYNKALEVAFVRKGQVVLHDTNLIVSGSVLRFRLPFINSIFEGLLTYPSYRTIPYGAIVRYRASHTLSGQTRISDFFRRLHRIEYRLPSGKKVKLSFTVLGGAARSKEFQAALNDNLTATKSLFTM